METFKNYSSLSDQFPNIKERQRMCIYICRYVYIGKVYFGVQFPALSKYYLSERNR